MLAEDEFRIKMLSTLADVARGRRMNARDFITMAWQKQVALDMRQEGWVKFITKGGIKQVWITNEGRSALRKFQRIFR